MFTVSYQGITHTCGDPGCHVIGFVNTLLEHAAVEQITEGNGRVLRLVSDPEEE